MKYSDVPNTSVQLTPQNYENIFSIFEDTDGFYYFNLIRTINFPTNLDTSTFDWYQVTAGDIWPLIAWKMYKNVKLWWVICAANQIQDPTQSPVVGAKIKIIKREVIKDLLNQIKAT